MKKLLIALAGIALLALGASWLIGRVVALFWSNEPIVRSGAQPWPGGLGTLDSVAQRVTPQAANETSKKLTALENARPMDVAAIRALLLREPVVWGREGGVVEVGNQGTTDRRVVVMTIARALVADAVTTRSWDDLHAAFNLARSLDAQPELMEQTAGLSIARMINDVAWKMPLPAPAWLDELEARDYVRPLLEAFQYQTADYWQSGRMPTKWRAESAEEDRRIAEAVFNETRCDAHPPVNRNGSDLTPIWRRAFRYRAEREATANALRVREGKPIDTHSRCSDGTWSFDGTTLRFSRDIGLALRVR